MTFCRHCGRQLADGEVCNCMQANGQVNDNTGGKNKLKNNKKLLLIPAIAAVVVVIILVVALTSGGGSYMRPVNDAIALINKKSIDSNKYVFVMTSGDLAAPMKKITNILLKADKDYFEDENEYFEEFYEELDDEWDQWKLSFEMKSKDKIDEDDIEDLQEKYRDNFDDYYESYIDDAEDVLDDDDELEDFADELDVSEKEAKNVINEMIKFYQKYENIKITEGYEVKGKFIIKADKDEYKTKNVKFYVYKINGDWCYGGSEGFYFEDTDGVSVGAIQNIFNRSYMFPDMF